MKKQYTKLQHYVPRCYLKNFSVIENDNYFTCCLFKNSFIQKKINIKNVCAVNDLYELQYSNGYVDRNMIEDGFVDLESRYADCCRHILFNIGHCETMELSKFQLDLIKTFCSLSVKESK